MATTARNKNIQIDLTGVGDDSTTVRIRVDVFGDKELAATVLGKIRDNL